MGITVRFFASLRERVGKDNIEISDQQLGEGQIATVDDVWAAVVGFERPANTLAAVNHDYVALDHAVKSGDEVAFFPPVTGG